MQSRKIPGHIVYVVVRMVVSSLTYFKYATNRVTFHILIYLVSEMKDLKSSPSAIKPFDLTCFSFSL